MCYLFAAIDQSFKLKKKEVLMKDDFVSSTVIQHKMSPKGLAEEENGRRIGNLLALGISPEFFVK